MKLIKLIPKLPFRIIMEDEIIHSDTLFSALINDIVMLYGNDATEKFINYFNNGEIAISSLLLGLNIYREDEFIKHILFFPKPFARISLSEPGNFKEEESEKYDKKKAKKVKFLSLNLLKEVLNNWDESKKFYRYDLLKQPSFGDEFCFNISEVPLNNEPDREEFKKEIKNNKFISKSEEQKILGSRFESETSELFSQEEAELKIINYGKLRFKPFMFFLLNENLPEDDFKILQATLRLLCDEGIGPKRRTGKGIFKDVIIDDIELPQSGKFAINLSLVFPQESDNLNNLIFYNFIKRGGYIYSNENLNANNSLKSKVRMFTEGSIYKDEIKGKLVDVSPNTELAHKIYRYGLNFPLYFGGQNEM